MFSLLLINPLRPKLISKKFEIKVFSKMVQNFNILTYSYYFPKVYITIYYPKVH